MELTFSPGATASHKWACFAELHKVIRSPLRPTAGDVAKFRSAIESHAEDVLLLGVTPELAVLGDKLTAADLSASMIDMVWPGDTARRRAIVANWNSLPFADASFTAVIGDGSLSAAGSNVPRVLREVRRVLKPGGVAVFRAFCAPSRTESLAAIAADVKAGWSGNPHALKFRVAMAEARSSEQWSVPVRQIKAAFDRTFPDRASLCDLLGCEPGEVDTVDFYEQAEHSLQFLPSDALAEEAGRIFDQVEVIASQGYPLCECCPILVLY